ncbi:Microfibril-associated glycoprotein 3 [Bienertia sinuspersici]
MATMGFTLDDDNFDDAFFEEVDKLEELATSSTQQQQHNQFLNSKPPSSLYSHHPQQQTSVIVDQLPSHSPPRQLSQRNPGNFTRSCISTRSVSSPSNDEQREIERLKGELRGVSKELLDLKQECFELKKQREKEQQLNCVHFNNKSRTCNAKDYSRNGISPTYEYINAAANQAAPWAGPEKISTGIQTDKSDGSLNPSTSGSTSTYRNLSELLSIWSPLRSHISRRNFVAKLLEACASDFFVLFGCLGLDMTSSEVARVSKLHSVLMELTDDTANINAFLEAVLDLCSLENCNLLRDNIKVQKCYSGSDAVRILDPEVGKSGSVCDISEDEACHANFILDCKNIHAAEHEALSLLCHVDWLHLFTLVCELASKLTEEQARVEAVTIMNIILMRTNPCSDRGKFGGSLVFEAVTLLLRKEAGFFCRKEAVHLFCKEADHHTQSSNDGAKGLACQKSHAVLEGLAECVFCSEYVVKELNLRRNAIVVLSFLASSGKCGLEIFLFHKLPKRDATFTNFLGLVLQVLVSEIEAEAFESCPAPESSKERTLLMREALILLNRLVSHPAYSAMVLQTLTSCRDMVSLAIDISTKLSKKSQRLQKFDSITKQMREYVVDMACLFKKRVFSSCNE